MSRHCEVVDAGQTAEYDYFKRGGPAIAGPEVACVHSVVCSRAGYQALAHLAIDPAQGALAIVNHFAALASHSCSLAVRFVFAPKRRSESRCHRKSLSTLWWLAVRMLGSYPFGSSRLRQRTGRLCGRRQVGSRMRKGIRRQGGPEERPRGRKTICRLPRRRRQCRQMRDRRGAQEGAGASAPARTMRDPGQQRRQLR